MPEVLSREIDRYEITAGRGRFEYRPLPGGRAMIIVCSSDTKIDLKAPPEDRDFERETWEPLFAVCAQTPESAEGYAGAFQELADRMRRRNEEEVTEGNDDG